MTKRSGTRSIDDYELLFRYSQWANDRMLDTMRATEDVPERAVELFGHLLRAQDLWYGRVEDTAHAEISLWAEDDLSACAERAEASARRWRMVLENVVANDLNQPVAYTNSKGTNFETPLRDILNHIVNHGTHHRAQISLVLRDAGIAPPPTDYIFFVREE